MDRTREKTPTRVKSRPADLGRYNWLAGVLLVGTLFASCASVRERTPVPEDLVEVAAVPGIPRARFFGEDTPAWLDEEVQEIVQRRASDPALRDREYSGCYLAISGGGANGAFGAGLLNGWTAAGTRPSFDMVTGISTGALTAPFAFLGPEYDHVLEEVYTTLQTSDVLEKRRILKGLTGDAMADSAPLQRMIAKYVDEDLKQKIAQEYYAGRELLVATTNVDAGRSVVWSLASIAASDAPNALELMRSVMLASASIPGAFPPVIIEVEADGQRYDEMHVDGGASSQVFLYPAELDWRSVTDTLEMTGEQYVYVIRNGRLSPRWEATEAKLGPIVGRTISTLITTQGVGDLYRIFIGARRDGLEFRLASIPDDFNEESKEAFDPEYMKKLYDLGFQMAKAGYPWDTTPPGMAQP